MMDRKSFARFAEADLAKWRGLGGQSRVADLGVDQAGRAMGSGLLGRDSMPADWISLESGVYEGGLRAWTQDERVIVLDGKYPVQPDGEPMAAPGLGNPEEVADTWLGRVHLLEGELIYATQGLTLRVNPDNGVLLAVIGYAPTTSEDYLSRLRPPEWALGDGDRP